MAGMYFSSVIPRHLFAELDRLQREMQQVFDQSPSMSGWSPAP